MSGRRERATLIGIMGVALAARLYGISLPLLDSIHQRQTQTAMATRNLYRDGMNIFLTRYDHFGNTAGYAILEFPWLNSITALLYYVFGVHEVIGRLIAVAFSMGAIIMMYRLAGLLLPAGPALAATAFYAFSPSNIYFSRAFMPESPMMFFLVTAAWAFLEWDRRGGAARFLLAALFTAAAILAKTPAVLILIPMAIACLARRGWRGLVRPQFLGFLFLALLPGILWNVHATAVNAVFVPGLKPTSILLDRGGELGLRVSATFWTEIMKYFIVFLLTPLGFLLAAAGLIAPEMRRARPLLSAWLLAWAGFVLLEASLVMGHGYYELPMLPATAILAAGGSWWIYERRSAIRARLSAPVWRVTLALSVLFVASHAVLYAYCYHDLYDITRRVPWHLEAAAAVREYTAPDAILILNDLNASNTTLPYYADRRCWTFDLAPGEQAIKDLESFRAREGTFYVAVDSSYYNRVQESKDNIAFWKYLNSRYLPLVLADHYVIFDLRSPRSGEGD